MKNKTPSIIECLQPKYAFSLSWPTLGRIWYFNGTFTAGVTGGDDRFLKNGWTFSSGSGASFCYSTRSLAAVRWANTIGEPCEAEAKEAMKTHVDDNKWAANKERERLVQVAAWEEAQRKIHDRIVARAKKKLTRAEFDAVIEEGRGP